MVSTKSQKTLAAISLVSQVAMANPAGAGANNSQKLDNQAQAVLSVMTTEERTDILNKMMELTHRPVGQIKTEDELYLEQQVTDVLGFEVSSELEGNRLQSINGVMGGEQHLMRFSGDTVDNHDYPESGIAPSRGAFGWFMDGASLSPEAVAREKYYIALPLMYLPDWSQKYVQLKPWYKFRKMVVVNPAEELAVVVVVGDAGPAAWVQKQSGGSPEVIREGKIWSQKARGHVLIFYVDDPENKIALGPRVFHWPKLL